jgi:hypothetical protein
MFQDEPPWRRDFIVAMYVSIGSRARMLRAHLDRRAEAVASTEETTRLGRAADYLESAEREVAALLPHEAHSQTSRAAYGTYLGDEIGAVLLRIQDYGELCAGVAAGLHACQNELTADEERDARLIEELLAQAARYLE